MYRCKYLDACEVTFMILLHEPKVLLNLHAYAMTVVELYSTLMHVHLRDRSNGFK